MRNSNYESRCDLAYTHSKILSFESSLDLYISNYASRCDFGVHTVQTTVFRILIQNAHFQLKLKLRTLLSCENSLWLRKICVMRTIECQWFNFSPCSPWHRFMYRASSLKLICPIYSITYLDDKSIDDPETKDMLHEYSQKLISLFLFLSEGCTYTCTCM